MGQGTVNEMKALQITMERHFLRGNVYGVSVGRW